MKQDFLAQLVQQVLQAQLDQLGLLVKLDNGDQQVRLVDLDLKVKWDQQGPQDHQVQVAQLVHQAQQVPLALLVLLVIEETRVTKGDLVPRDQVVLREIEVTVVIQDQQDPVVQLDQQGLLALLAREDHRVDQDHLGLMEEKEKQAQQDLQVLLVKEEMLVTQEQQATLDQLGH